MTNLVRVTLLSLTLVGCATAAEPSSLPTPTPEAIDYANHLETCDPAFANVLASVTSGQSTVEPMPSSKCQLGENLLDASGCRFISWWNWAGFTDRAACLALGLPLCYATICVAGWLDS